MNLPLPSPGEGRVQPHDLEAEASVLGALLLDQTALSRVFEIVQPEDFYRENNGQIYRAAIELFRDGEPIDQVTLADQLQKQGVLERVGGRAHLATLQEQTPTAANVEYYGRIVKAHAYKRALITAGGEVTALGYDDALEAEEALNSAQAKVFSIAEQRVGSGMERLYDLLKPAMDRIDAQMASGGGVVGVPSGFHELDRVTNGFKPSDMVVIAGRPSMGKALALDTPIPTPAGWTTMGRLRPGDQVLDEEGAPCSVTYATPVQVGRECFEVALSDGSTLLADAEHLWTTAPPAARGATPSFRVRTTREVAATLRTPAGNPAHHLPTRQAALVGAGSGAPCRPAAPSEGGQTEKERWVESVRPVESVPVRCIRVDSPTHLYLAGRGRIPTHNTSFVLNIALHAAIEHKLPVAIFSLEMSKEQLVERMLCEQARIDAQRLHRGMLSEREHEQLVYSLGPLGDAPIFIDDTPMLDDLTLRLKARQASARDGVQMIVVDYLQLMHGRPSSNDSNRVQEVSLISRSMKAIARELRVPIIAISQLSRAPEQRPDKRPILSDLRDSGCLPASTRLLRADHDREVTLGELVRTGEQPLIWSIDAHRRFVRRRLTRAFASGVKIVHRLGFRSGRSVDASANHRFLSPAGWARLDELAPGTTVGTIGRCDRERDRGTGGEALQVAPALCWDEIVEITPLGEQPVFDATVEDTHNFVADGVVAHNSIEQDADLVMFLYRDDYYNREKSEKPGIAEILIAKHRNGPTGTIDLRFVRELTRFESIDKRHAGFEVEE
ncbi:MAG: replicative DNA helicase [Candidatus Dormibacteraceae bacterium]